MAHIATLAHISDLHFVDELTELGKRVSFIGPKSHSFAKVYALANAFFEIKYIKKKSIDLLVLSGDVTTEGSRGALNTALEFVANKDIHRYVPRRRICGGLGIDQNNRIVVPGNHDRFGLLPQQVGSQRLEEVFGARTEYPYAIGFRPLNTEVVSEGQTSELPAIIFFVFDSTLVKPGRFDILNKIARGRVEVGECDKLKELCQIIRNTGEVPGINGEPMQVDFNNCVRIAVLHHHPVFPTEVADERLNRVQRAMRKFKSRLSLMENAQHFVDACVQAGINIVLFGHQHQAYENPIIRDVAETQTSSRRQKVHFICCPSTSEYSEPMVGFNLIDISTEEYTVHYYRLRSTKTQPANFSLENSFTFNYVDLVQSTAG